MAYIIFTILVGVALIALMFIPDRLPFSLLNGWDGRRIAIGILMLFCGVTGWYSGTGTANALRYGVAVFAICFVWTAVNLIIRLGRLRKSLMQLSNPTPEALREAQAALDERRRAEHYSTSSVDEGFFVSSEPRCVRCHGLFPTGATACPECGWNGHDLPSRKQSQSVASDAHDGSRFIVGPNGDTRRA